MSLDLRLPAAASHWFAPIETRLAPLFCLVLSASSCASASFAFACATPFAAFAVVASSLLPLVPALLVMIGAWLVNQGHRLWRSRLSARWLLIEQRPATVLPSAMTFVFDAEFLAQNSRIAVVRDARASVQRTRTR